MGRPKRTTCKFERCDQPIYVSPGGYKDALCKAHRKLRHYKKRDGLPSMTGYMKATLRYLRDMKAAGYKFVDLSYPTAETRTVTALLERDWIFASPGEDGVRYCITGRGEKALKVYGPKRNRKDGICPRCGINPRPHGNRGHLEALCVECERARCREKNQRQKRKEGICCRCHKRPRHQYAGGTFSAYCTHCERVRGRRRLRRKKRELRRVLEEAGQ